MKWHESYIRRFPISVHPAPFDREQSNREQDYGRRFVRGYETRRVNLHELAEIVTKQVICCGILDNGYKSKTSFQRSFIGAIDVDEGGEYSLDQAMKEFCDTICIIGTSRNHQVEKNGVVCDRYRIFVVWEKPCVSIDAHANSLIPLQLDYNSDASANSGVQLFYPLKEIVAVNDSGYLQPIQAMPSDASGFQTKTDIEMHRAMSNGMRKGWVKRFLNEGKIPAFHKSRNWCVWEVCLLLLIEGLKPGKILELVKGAPFDRQGFDNANFEARLKSAQRRFDKLMATED